MIEAGNEVFRNSIRSPVVRDIKTSDGTQFSEIVIDLTGRCALKLVEDGDVAVRSNNGGNIEARA